MDYKVATLICKALSDENRMRIFEMLAPGERCGCELLAELQITQPTLSHHMKIMESCGLVKSRIEGKWHHYSLNQDLITEILDHFDELRSTGLPTYRKWPKGCCEDKAK